MRLNCEFKVKCRVLVIVVGLSRQALTLGLNGYVKNLVTGEVEALIIGTEDAIHKILKHSLVGLYVPT